MRASIIRSGFETFISDGSLCWLIGYDGLGLANAERHSESGPNQHGDTDRGFNLEPRFITLVLSVVGTGQTIPEAKADLASKAARVFRLFKAAKAPLILRLYLDDGAIRQIDCHYSGRMEVGSADKPHRLAQKMAITLKASDPSFYDPESHGVSFALGAGAEGFDVPMEVPHAVGASVINQVHLIEYAGSWLSYPWMRITGPFTDPVIEHVDLGYRIDLTGITIASDDFYEIELRYGNKVVRDSEGNYKNGELVNPSDLAQFAIYPDPDVTDGKNRIRVTGSNATGATRVDVVYWDRFDYGGVS